MSCVLLIAGAMHAPAWSAAPDAANAVARVGNPSAAAADALPDLPLALLGSVEFEIGAHRYGQRWERVLARIEYERALYDFCAWPSEGCPEALTRWRAQLAALDGLAPLEQLRRLNRAVNALVPYASDREVYGKADYWASPLEFLQNSGDCEDFAILKFVSLLELGFSDDKMRLVVVRDRKHDRLHAVLTVELDGRAYVLDNSFAEPVEHQHLLRYRPVYSANRDTQWVHLVTGPIRGRFIAKLAEGPAARPGWLSGEDTPPPR